MKKECMVTIVHTVEEEEEILLETFVSRIDDGTPINIIRIGEAFYCGRTDALMNNYPSTNGNTTIYYLDFTSLYPWVQNTQKYLVGLPNKLTGDKIPSIPEFIKHMNTDYFGFAYVFVLPPPQKLYIPVLPGRYKDRLMFVLCRKCTEDGNESEYKHTEHQREFKGVYATPELELAMQKGYEIRKICELWTFEDSWNLFKRHIKEFLKIKPEASGVSDVKRTEEEILVFIEQFYQHE